MSRGECPSPVYKEVQARQEPVAQQTALEQFVEPVISVYYKLVMAPPCTPMGWA
jgi:hypothetical protein